MLEATGAGFPVFNVYRLLMRALGTRLVAVAGASKRSTLSRIAMRAFAFGLGLNTQLSRRGWQIVAVAHASEVGSPRRIVDE